MNSNSSLPPYLDPGSFGSGVHFVQELLSENVESFADLELTGVHAGAWVEAVQNLQRSWNISDDGGMGPEFRAAFQERYPKMQMNVYLVGPTVWYGPDMPAQIWVSDAFVPRSTSAFEEGENGVLVEFPIDTTKELDEMRSVISCGAPGYDQATDLVVVRTGMHKSRLKCSGDPLMHFIQRDVPVQLLCELTKHLTQRLILVTDYLD